MLDWTPDETNVRLAALHMEGKALSWHRNYIKGRFDVYPSWTEYVVDASTIFGKMYDDPLSNLVNMKQVEPTDEYLDKFEIALTRL